MAMPDERDDEQKISQILLRDDRYNREAYRFLQEGLEYTVQRRGKRGHVTGPELLEGVMRRFYRAWQAYQAPISLVGQSLGGVFSREVARKFPDATRCVITLGSPFAATEHGNTNAMIGRLFEEMSGLSVEEMRARFGHGDPRAPLPMPSTAVYSKRDGVVAWDTCVERDSPLAESIEVQGSHSGMAVSPDVLHVVADRLAENPANWRKFDRKRGMRCLVYPTPTSAP